MVAIVAMLAVASSGRSTTAAENPVEIDVVLPMTGNAALLGATGAQAVELIEKQVNSEGGINGRPVHFVVYDDQTSPQVAVQIANELLQKSPPVILGSSVTAMCNAMAPLMRKGPVMYCYSPGIQPEPGSYVFSATVPTYGLVETMLRFFHQRGWNRLAVLMSTDATGQDGDRSVTRALALPDLKDMTIVAREYFNSSDVTVQAQLERIKAAQPQAMISWTTGAAMGTVMRGMIQAALDVPFAPSSGNISYTFMRQYAAVLPRQMYLSSNQGTARGQHLSLDPRTEVAKKKYYDLFKTVGVLPDTGSEISWDATMILVEALRHVGPHPTAEKMRDYIAHLKNYAGISGVYDFEKYPQRGLNPNSAVIVRWNPEGPSFEAITQPGGVPIKP